MTPPETTALLAEIVSVLDDERDALRAAAFSRLAPLALRKHALLERVGATAAPEHAAATEAVRRAAQRNQRLLLASLRGVRAARQRLDEIRAAGRTLNTYDNLGKRHDIQVEAAQLEHRA